MDVCGSQLDLNSHIYKRKVLPILNKFDEAKKKEEMPNT